MAQGAIRVRDGFRALENSIDYDMVRNIQGDFVSKRKITAKEIMADLRSGLDDPALMKKYNLSSEGLQSLFKKMLKAGVISRNELDSRTPMLEKTVELGLFICPACGNIEHNEFKKCPKCGFAAPEYMKTPDYGDQSKQKKSPKMRGSREARASTSRQALRTRGAQKATTDSDPKGDDSPAEDDKAKRLKIMGIASMAAYILFLIILIVFVAIFSSQGLVSVTTALVGILVLQIPAALVFATTFLSFKALAGQS
jgi:ribosomal protein L37E